MNKNVLTILATTAIALAAGRATAGTWVNGYYVDGPLRTVCDGARIITHAYGTTVCSHCNGTGMEPQENTVVVENVIVDTWSPPPPPRYHRHLPRVHHNPPHHGGGHCPAPRPVARPVGRGVRIGGRGRR